MGLITSLHNFPKSQPQFLGGEYDVLAKLAMQRMSSAAEASRIVGEGLLESSIDF